MRVLIAQKEISSLVKSLALQVDRACRQQRVSELAVVCVMDGAFMFTADLVRAMRTPTRVIFLKATSYLGTRKAATRVAALPGSIRSGPVLIVDTIYDTGRTIARVVRLVREVARPVWLAVLVEKQGKTVLRPADHADQAFSGIKLKRDPFLVGYGLDVEGSFRNFADIYEYTASHASEARAVRRRR